MKRLLITFSVMLCFAASSCSGQNNNASAQDNRPGDQENKITGKGKTNSPRINSKVNREYDENGNLRRYDSTYTYYYNSAGNSPDSIPEFFRNFSSRSFPGDSAFFKDPFSGDSFFRDFFSNDNFSGDLFFNGKAGRDSTDKHVPRIAGPDEFMFNSDRFKQMFRYFDSLNKSFMNRDFDPEKFFKQQEKSKKMNNVNSLKI